MSITIESLINESHQTATAKGWWDDPNRNVGELLALIHSEVSEALEVYRVKGKDSLNENWLGDKGKPEGFTVELADVIIRIADFCGEFGLDLEESLTAKLAYNRTRPYRHGDKKA
jgi:NTP pyrophosphatase (non-canonical NTP hydrolase)